ncbi:MAG: hypothetical protein K0U59_09545 [Gammaproteobacteria bacterium]|nr:hypothetical protein [Gammaproteobacteria bacterium]
MVKTFAICFFLISLAACKGFDTKETVIDVTDIMSSGNDGVSGEFCADFSLNKDEAQYFFNNATRVSARDIHDNYAFLPCFVKGVGYLNNKNCEWEIRAGGTSSITCEDMSITMACEDCLPIPE